MAEIYKNPENKKKFKLQKNNSNKMRVVKMATNLLEEGNAVEENAQRSVTSTVQKWGNSLAVRIPKEMADHKDFNNGTVVKITETKDGVKIILKKKKVEYKLSDLLRKCTPENQHDPIDFGFAGKE